MNTVFTSILLVCVFFVGELRLLIMTDIKNQCVLTPVVLLLCYVCVCMCVCVSFNLLVWGYLFLVFSWVWLASLGWCFPGTFSGAELVDRCCLNWFLSGMFFSIYSD